MKFQADLPQGLNVVTALDPGGVRAAGRLWTGSLVLPWQGEARSWDVAGFEALGEAHFEALAALGPELVIFGSGARLRFPRPAWLRPLIERRIGLETMDTAAACRTYNVLRSEDRAVVAALLIGG